MQACNPIPWEMETECKCEAGLGYTGKTQVTPLHSKEMEGEDSLNLLKVDHSMFSALFTKLCTHSQLQDIL